MLAQWTTNGSCNGECPVRLCVRLKAPNWPIRLCVCAFGFRRGGGALLTQPRRPLAATNRLPPLLFLLQLCGRRFDCSYSFTSPSLRSWPLSFASDAHKSSAGASCSGGGGRSSSSCHSSLRECPAEVGVALAVASSADQAGYLRRSGLDCSGGRRRFCAKKPRVAITPARPRPLLLAGARVCGANTAGSRQQTVGGWQSATRG